MNRHDIDAVSLAFGVVFLTVVGWWMLVRSVDIDPPSAGWFAAGGLLLAGVIGLAATVWPRRDTRTNDASRQLPG